MSERITGKEGNDRRGAGRNKLALFKLAICACCYIPLMKETSAFILLCVEVDRWVEDSLELTAVDGRGWDEDGRKWCGHGF